MCDTLVALGAATRRGERLFAKNSDRERNEAQAVEMHPAASHAPGARVRLTYITIEQAPRTHATLICRPYWMWGAEMGANEHGVVVGNEAVQSVVPANRRRALTGMDLVRLAVERAASAEEVVDVITTLLERHGQGGDCGHLKRFYYHNSFLIADRRQAFVLETVGRWWAVQTVARTRAISNALSIGVDYERISEGLRAHADEACWTGADGRFDFAGRLIDKAPDAATQGLGRCARARSLLACNDGKLTAEEMMAILRDHGPAARDNPGWTPWTAPHRTLCMHAAGGERRSQTTGSLVTEAVAGIDIHWVTATAAPCLSVFKPVLFAAGLPEQGPPPGERYDAASLWWRHERLHRAVLEDYAARVAEFVDERAALEHSFSERIAGVVAAGARPQEAKAIVADCWREAEAAEVRWLTSLARAGDGPAPAPPDLSAWRRLNARAGLPSCP